MVNGIGIGRASSWVAGAAGMTWFVRDGLQRFEVFNLRAISEKSEGKHFVHFADLSAAILFLRRFLFDPMVMGSMRAALLESSTLGPGSLWQLDDDQVIRCVGLLLLAGTLRIATRKELLPEFPVRWKDPEEPAPPPAKPPAAKPEKTWIEIVLLDEEGTTIPEEPYWIELPNKKVVEGKLDKNGRAKVKDIDPGTCKVRFPKLDGGAGHHGQHNEKEKSWIDIHLADEEGHPVPEAKYRIELADSSVIEGNLDKEGKAHIEGIDPGSCHVTFPDLDEWKHHSSA